MEAKYCPLFLPTMLHFEINIYLKLNSFSKREQTQSLSHMHTFTKIDHASKLAIGHFVII